MSRSPRILCPRPARNARSRPRPRPCPRSRFSRAARSLDRALGTLALGATLLAGGLATFGLLATGCTLAEEPLWSGSRVTSGVAPYRDIGGVEICVSDHRLGSPDTDLAGFCVPKSAPERSPCSTDADCASRESCVCGFCTVKYCTRNDECGEGRVCDFTLSRCVAKCETYCDCEGPNARCDIGMCQQLCIVNAECQSGEICSLSRARCISVPCSGDDDCFPEEECIIQREPRQLTEPTVVDNPDGGYVVFFDMIHAGPFERPRHMIFRAITGTGEFWTVDPAAPVLEPDIPDDYRAPTVRVRESGYVMYVELGSGEGIARAESADGRSWTFEPEQPVLTPTTDWEDGRVASPAVVMGLDDLPRLYYEFGQGAGIAMVRAADRDGLAFETAPEQRMRVLEPDQVTHEILWRNVTRVRSPYVLLEEDFEGEPLYRLYFSARGFESPQASSFGSVAQIPSNYSIGYAASRDGEVFEVYPYNPVYDRILANTFVNHASELAPAVFAMPGRYLLYYAAANRDLGDWENFRIAVNPPPQAK